MMKKITLFVALCVATFSFAQNTNDSKDAVLTDITNETCECVGSKNTDGMSQAQLQTELGFCMMKIYGKYKKRVDKFMDVSIDDEKSLELFGQEIGFKMLEMCPNILMQVAEDYIEEELQEESGKPAVKSVFGKIKKIKDDQFNLVILEESNKREHNFLWLEFFEGQELLADVKSLSNKRVEVMYVEREMYDPKMKDYRIYKVLQGIKLL